MLHSCAHKHTLTHMHKQRNIHSSCPQFMLQYPCNSVNHGYNSAYPIGHIFAGFKFRGFPESRYYSRKLKMRNAG